jgi:ketosteroid isomerase-like protein
MLAPADQLAIRRVVELYGYLIDNRMFSRIDEVFTEDIVYDVSDFGHGVLHGIPAVVEFWRTTSHPLAHHATNVFIEERDDGTAAVIVMLIGVGYKGRVGSATYYDTAVQTPDGWRLSHLRAVPRRPETIPPES